MRRLLLLAALLVSRTAAANQCPALNRFVVTPEIPLGCPLVVYQDHEWHSGMVPGLLVDRGGVQSELIPTVTTENETLSIYFDTIDENCVEFHGYQDRLWDRMTMDLGDSVQVGDVIQIDYSYIYPNPTITAAGPCPVAGPPEYITCTDPYQDYQACDMPPGDEVTPPDGGGGGSSGYFGGGCNAGGKSLSLAGIALLIGLRRRRVTSQR